MTVIVSGYQTTQAKSSIDGDTLLVTRTGVVAYDGNAAIFLPANNQRATVFGEVYSSSGTAINLQASNGKVFIAGSANVSGLVAVQIGTNGYVRNAGTIEGSIDMGSGKLDNTGKIFGDVFIGFDGSIVNYGDILGFTEVGLGVDSFSVYNSGHMRRLELSAQLANSLENHGLIDVFYSREPVTLINTGTIDNFRIDGSGKIINHGFIGGEGLLLSDADDYYDGRDGVAAGRISSRGGRDTLLGGARSDFLDGREIGARAGADKLYGYGGDDVLYGDGGDLLAGGSGDDTFVIGAAKITIQENLGGGIDTVESGVGYRLAANVENLILIGSGKISGFGNNLVNDITGNAAANLLDGDAGADALRGGGGSDTYVVDNPGDVVVEPAGQGRDLVRSSVSYTLGASVEDLTLTGAAVRATGNALANVVSGNSGANLLDGGAGKDTLKGLAGADNFLFDTTLGPGNIDHIVDFSAAADTIRLENAVFKGLAPGALPAAQFKYLSARTVDANDRLLYDRGTGRLYFDADGSRIGSAFQFAVLDNHPILTAADFLVT